MITLKRKDESVVVVADFVKDAFSDAFKNVICQHTHSQGVQDDLYVDELALDV